MHIVRWPARPLFQSLSPHRPPLQEPINPNLAGDFAQASEADGSPFDIALQINMPSLLPVTPPHIGLSKFVAARIRDWTSQRCSHTVPLLRRMRPESVESTIMSVRTPFRKTFKRSWCRVDRLKLGFRTLQFPRKVLGVGTV
ncbi:unnamed protein product [Symbiodinium sp. CCMP2456]|nr:unnamed protein product [Symbiodinium sp. CCMP2456]